MVSTPNHTTNFAERVDKLLARLGEELVSIYESECAAADDRTHTPNSFGRFCNELVHVSSGKYDVNTDTDQEAPVLCAKRIQEEAAHCAAGPKNPAVTRATSSASLLAARIMDSMAKVERGAIGMKTLLEKIETRTRMNWVARETGVFFCLWSIQLYSFIVLLVWSDTLGLADDWEGETGPLGATFDIVALTIFTLDILLNFNTTFEDRRGVVVVDRKEICKHYLKTWFVFDVLVTIPYDVFTTGEAGRSARVGKLLKCLKLVRMMKILKMNLSPYFSILEALDDKLSTIADVSVLQTMMNRIRLISAVARFSLLLFVESHIISCSLLYANRGESVGREYQSFEVANLTPWLRYLFLLRWTLVSCATGITGDYSLQYVAAHSDPHLVRISLLFVFAANMVYGHSLLSNLKGSDDMDFSYRLRMLDMTLRKRKNVSRHTRRGIVQYHKSQAARGQRSKIMKLLTNVPDHLLQRVAFETYAEYMLKFVLFTQGPLTNLEMRERFLSALCLMLETRYFISKEVVVERRHKLEGMYCRIDGNLVQSETSFDLDDDQLESAAHASVSPTFFGIEALLGPTTPSWQIARVTVMSLNQSEVALLTRRNFDEIVVEPDWAPFFEFVRSQVLSTHVSESHDVMQDLASNGLSTEQQDKYKWFEGRAAASSEELGVSAKYLLSRFTDDVISHVGDVDLETSSFSDLKTHFWDAEHRGFKDSASKVCPRDGFAGCAIVDVLDENDAGRATHFVSWCWRYTVMSVVSALQAWSDERAKDNCHDDAEVFLWLCFFCNNQRKLLIDGDTVNLVETFGQRLERVGRMIVVLDKYDAPLYTTRLWCIFEAYTATVKNISVDVALPKESMYELNQVVKSPFGFFQIMRSLADINTATAEASVKEDENLIRDIIRNSTGFSAVNTTVKAAITKWLGLAFEAAFLEETNRDVKMTL